MLNVPDVFVVFVLSVSLDELFKLLDRVSDDYDLTSLGLQSQ
jgi:hypothetical protein